jgi:hypothetical protein
LWVVGIDFDGLPRFPYEINAKPTKSRNTLVKQIVELAKRNDVLSRTDVVDVCKFGRQLSWLEQQIREYYASIEAVEMAKSDPKKGRMPMVMHDGLRQRNITWLTSAKFMLKHVEKGLVELFIKALKENDAELIIEIAQAVLFFKDKRHGLEAADRERGLLLYAKARLNLYDQKWTIRQVAEYLAGGKVETPADGFSALRRKCRELNFPLAPSRKTSKK